MPLRPAPECAMAAKLIPMFLFPMRRSSALARYMAASLVVVLCLVPQAFAGDAQRGDAAPVFVKATWLHEGWLAGNRSELVDRLLHDIDRLGVSTIYPRLAPGMSRSVEVHGRVWLEDVDEARALMAALRARMPQLRVIPYKGISDCSRIWSDDQWRARTLEAYAGSLVALEADGIQVDMECADIDQPEYTHKLHAFLAELKAKIGPDKLLSVAIPVLSEEQAAYKGTQYASAPWAASLLATPRPVRWARLPRVYEVVFEEADQVVAMLYDTWLRPEQRDIYVRHAAHQIWAGTWFASRSGAEYLAGIRFSTQDGKHHWRAVENLASASLALGQFNDRPISAEQKVSEHLAGVAIFRLDVAYEPGYRPSEGEEMLARFGEIGAERRGEVSR
jgi:hypothetical protein